MNKLCWLGLVSLWCWICVLQSVAAEALVVRIGHFPNVTHAHGVIAHGESAKGKGWFESRLEGVKSIEWFTYNAGPSAMEALLLNAIDCSYVGPNPALNAFARTKGKEVRIIAGATRGGGALVVHQDSGLKIPGDFRGKRIATPQLGNTQDISARYWFHNGGLRVTQSGGDVSILPTENPEQLSLFKSRSIDGVWTIEPWVSRLVREAQGKVLVEEKDALTTLFVCSQRFISSHPDLVQQLRHAHIELNKWIQDNPVEAQTKVREKLQELTKGKVSPELIQSSWQRLSFRTEIGPTDLTVLVETAQKTGFLKEIKSIDGIFFGP